MGDLVPSGGLFDSSFSGASALAQLGNDAYGTVTADPVADIFATPPMSLGVFGSSPVGTPAADPFADFFPVSSGPAIAPGGGADAIRFHMDRGGLGFMVTSPEGVMRDLRSELGEATFRRIEFLFSGDEVSLARIEGLRTRVAERAGHQYTDLDSTMAIVREVLLEDGIDCGGGECSTTRDVLEGVLLMQLLPDEIPLYRSTEFPGQAGEHGMSWWGVGENGMAVASDYATGGRVLMRATLGDLRQVGMLRSDLVALTGNALELYHWELPEGGYSGYTAIETQPLRFELSLENLSAERRQQVESCLCGRDPNSLAVGERKDLINMLTRDYGWSMVELEGAFGSRALLSLGYGLTINLNLPVFGE